MGDPMLDEPVWCVVDWAGVQRVSPTTLAEAREIAAQWNHAKVVRWVEAPEPEPEPVTAREVIATRLRDQVLVAGGGRSYDAADAALTALSAAGFRVVACAEDEVPVVLPVGFVDYKAETAPAGPGLSVLGDACRAALAAAGEGNDE